MGRDDQYESERVGGGRRSLSVSNLICFNFRDSSIVFVPMVYNIHTKN